MYVRMVGKRTPKGSATSAKREIQTTYLFWLFVSERWLEGPLATLSDGSASTAHVACEYAGGWDATQSGLIEAELQKLVAQAESSLNEEELQRSVRMGEKY